MKRDTSTQVHEDTRTKRERTRAASEARAVMEALDEILDGIDDLLKENADAWENFRQVGGE